MFITAVCVLFLIKLRWARNKSLYETHSLPDFFPRGGGGASVHRLLRSTMAAERFSNLNRRRHRLLTATEREQTIQYNITITDKEILVYIYIIIIIIITIIIIIIIRNRIIA